MSRVEQNVLILWYILRDSVTQNYVIYETFVELNSFLSKKWEKLPYILECSKQLEIIIKDCRAQGYDNAGNID